MRRTTRYKLWTGAVVVGLGVAAVAVGVSSGYFSLRDGVRFVGVLTLANLLLALLLIDLWGRPLAHLTERMEKAGSSIDPTYLERSDDIGELARRIDEILQGAEAAQQHSVELGRQQASIEKFAALGRLSAGVAHEINNPVGGILTCLETMRGLEPRSERYEEYLTLVTSGLERIGTIVRQLLSFSRQPAGTLERIDINDVIREVTILSAFHNRDENVEVVHEEGDVPPIPGFPDLLNQLFLNLVLNALQAMPDGGTLRIRTQVEDNEVVAVLEDTGPGLPLESVDRIFEPFFTTKEVGVGTGLGLSVALGVVEAHGGSIHAENRPEGGARFTVRLPVGLREDRPVRSEEDRTG